MLRIVLKQDGYSEMCFGNTQETVFSDDRGSFFHSVSPGSTYMCVKYRACVMTLREYFWHIVANVGYTELLKVYVTIDRGTLKLF